MIHTLYVYKTDCTDPYRNIATEKCLLDSVMPGCCILYLWQNSNTVVIGRNQNAWAECRTTLLEEENGHLARRLSGGGAVFHDLGNLNFTFIMCHEDYDLDRQLSVIEHACSYAGICVERSGRNDLLANGHKFSGNAFYHAQGKSYHHGTLLVNADIEKLGRYLTPPKAKLEAKGVASVRSRVINLQTLSPELTCEHLSLLMEKAYSQVYKLTPQTLTLPSSLVDKIDKYAKELSGWQWLYGQKLPFTVECSQRFSWGSIQLQLQVESGYITGVQVYSDAMQWQIADEIINGLTDCKFHLQGMSEALKNTIQDPDIYQDLSLLLTQLSI